MNEKLFEALHAKNIKVAYENDTNRPPYEGEMFFPNTRQVGLKFEFIKGKQGLPVALVAANFNTNVLYRDRIGFETLSGKLPFFKEATKIDEELRQQILFTNETFVEPLIKKALAQELELLDGADVTVERMRMQLLSQGTIAISENGVNKQYDYGFDGSNQLTTESVKWSTENAHPLKSLATQISEYEDKHNNSPVNYIVMSRKLFKQYICTDVDALKYFADVKNPFPSFEDFKVLAENKLGVTFILTNKKYLEARDFGGTPVPFYPEDRYTLLSDLDLGETVYGTTPEEASKLSGSDLNVEVTSKGVAITTWSIADAVSDDIKVSEVAIPTCPNLDKIQIVKVL